MHAELENISKANEQNCVNLFATNQGRVIIVKKCKCKNSQSKHKQSKQ